MTRLVLGVIGHVDHGKTALVRALTGLETDRLAEEKRRGISIALGFAHARFGGAEVDFIDMPGHERFVRAMIAGATGMDAVLLVIAANEGVKPQTVEHADIAGLLGVRRAVVAISKTDLAPPEPAAQAAAALLARAGIATAASVACSALTGAGMDALRDAIAAAAAGGAPPRADGVPFLPIDRAFSIAGHGTVVTGTLRGGPIATGETMALLPDGAEVRLRGLQVHGARVAAAEPGQRVAANLRGVEPGAIPRGAALAPPGLLPAAAWLGVSLRAVADGPTLVNGARLRLLLGTAELDARLRLLDRDMLEPGETAPAQLHCAAPVSVPARERFVLRLPSPPRTVAGGTILEPEGRRERRHAAPVLDRLAFLARAAPEGVIARQVDAAGAQGAPLARLARLSGLASARAAAALPGDAMLLGRTGVAIRRERFASLLTLLPARLAAKPAGVPREALAALFPDAGAKVLDEAVAQLVAAGTLRQRGGLIGVPRPDLDHTRAQEEAALATRLADTLRHAGLETPSIDAVAADPLARRALERLIRNGAVVRAPDKAQGRDVLFHRDAVAAAQRRLAPLLANPPGLLVREAGAALGISRKYSVPLLEHLDAIHFTRRVQDRRVLAKPG